MDYRPLEIPDVLLLEPVRHRDERGFFSEIYSRSAAAAAGIAADLVQENYSLSLAANTVRGLHFQTPPCAQGKLVQVVSGAILDVAVDLRKSSPWYGQYISVELSAENWSQLWVPEGFAHGFCTLEPDTAVIYKVSAPYSAEHDSGILWNDPELGIDWPVSGSDAVLSEKDAALQTFGDFETPFSYEGQAR